MPLREVLSAPLLSSEGGAQSDDIQALPFYKVAAPGSADLATLAWPMPTSAFLRQANDWTRQTSPLSTVSGGRKSSKQSAQSVRSDHERGSQWSSVSSAATHVTDVDCYWTRRKRLAEVMEETLTMRMDAERETDMMVGHNSLLISIVSLVSTCVGTGDGHDGWPQQPVDQHCVSGQHLRRHGIVGFAVLLLHCRFWAWRWFVVCLRHRVWLRVVLALSVLRVDSLLHL